MLMFKNFFPKIINALPLKDSHRDKSKPLPMDNFNQNKNIWSKYAVNWDKQNIYIENPNVSSKVEKDSYLNFIGDEWGNVADTIKLIEQYIYPYITKTSTVGEIGVGGGRIASKISSHVKKLYCFDISEPMLERAKNALSNYSNINYILLTEASLPESLSSSLDFIYSFDVFVHLDLHTIWKYFLEIRRILKPGGKAFLHTTNLKSPKGWERFSSQSHYSVEGHYFIIPEIIHILAEHANFSIIKESRIDNSNFYLNRDYLFVLHKV